MSDLVQYSLLLLISFSGIIIGSIVSSMAKEELKTGKKYFKLLRLIIIGMIVLFFMLSLNLNRAVSIVTALILTLLSYFCYAKTNFLKNFLLFAIFSIVVFKSLQSFYSPYILTLVFLFGLIVSSIDYKIKNNLLNNLKSTISMLIYPILGVLLYFLPKFF